MLNSLDDRDGLIWLDGELLPWREARLHVLTHALHMGGAVFEGMRAYGGHVFLNAPHLERFQQSAALLDYHLPWSQGELTQAIEAVLWANQLDDAYIRPVAWRGAESVSIASPRARIHVAIAAWDWPTAASQGRAEEGIRLQLASWRRPRPDTAPTAAKCSGLYMIGTLARHAAAAAGCDDALLLDSEGRVAETTATNLLMVHDGVLVTPLPTCFLDGITKRHVMGLARQRGLRVEERTVTLDELRAASEVFTAGTSVELQPVVALVEDAATTEWPVGPVTRQLIQDFRASVTEASQVGRTLREQETGLLERRPWPARVASALQAP
ncbi:branched-chain amino acid aminotransferase [Stenotrophomonas maltophilia]|uniref:Branched-chain-amino-acid aminotransferase n=1 Tax=Stenotrophomonas maltophilia TaxID=40324 RepID=A0A270NNV0_STEMA|nr:branched-chain amino acid transaminase [Stenotrophomonas maltophilia]PAM73799.1 branched-chain amino acid aminotransferase [Stenotrophomonas maltophilia]